MECQLKKFSELTPDELYGIIKLRVEIFVVEQDCVYQDLDGKDQISHHLFLKHDGEVVAYLRIIPQNVSFEDMAIGRLVVKKAFRGRGIARKLMLKAIDIIINDFGKSKIRLSGQAYLSDFYTGLGFERVSECYLEDGIPHFEFLYEV